MREDSPPLPIGVEMNFKIIKLNEVEKRIGLTLSTAIAEQERQRLGEYQRQAEQAGHGIGEAAQTEESHE
jgi:small subunit ribosomal protein S1